MSGFAATVARADQQQLIREATSDAFWLGTDTPEAVLEAQNDDWRTSMEALVDAQPATLVDLAEKARLAAAAMFVIHGPAGLGPDYALRLRSLGDEFGRCAGSRREAAGGSALT